MLPAPGLPGMKVKLPLNWLAVHGWTVAGDVSAATSASNAITLP